MSSEHRVLTSVDTLICKEVGASGSRGCVHSIPVMDIPRSPVFGSHDPIHLPWGDLAQVIPNYWCRYLLFDYAMFHVLAIIQLRACTQLLIICTYNLLPGYSFMVSIP